LILSFRPGGQNVVDHIALTDAPVIVSDLPAGGRRLDKTADG
jgi:hypothetical protein